MQARVAALETENTLLATERDILRQAAKYFAGVSSAVIRGTPWAVSVSWIARIRFARAAS